MLYNYNKMHGAKTNFELHSALYSFTLLSAVSFTFVAPEPFIKTKFYHRFYPFKGRYLYSTV